MTTGEKIVKLRKQAGYSQEAFSEIMGVSRQAVSKWENGTAQPTNENLQAICKLFGVSVSQLLDDEDIHTNNFSVDSASETIEVTEKIYSATRIVRGVATLLISIVLLLQGTKISSLKRELNVVRNEFNVLEQRMDNQINSIYSHINSLPQAVTQNSKDFTDYHYEVTDFDFDNNTALLKFSVVPTDYTQSTKAKIVIKSEKETYSADAVMENNIFTAQLQVPCVDNMTVYLYLTDGDTTRSFVLDLLDNPSENFVLGIWDNELEGEINAEKGKAKIDVNNHVSIKYVISDEEDMCVYPVKAVVKLYADGELIKEFPHASIMEFNFKEGYSDKGGAPQTAVAPADNVVNFGFWIEENITDERINKNSNFSADLVIVDTKGREYITPMTTVL